MTISFADPLACSPPCAYFIGVYGWASTASYSLVATLGTGVVHLLDGQPQFGYIAPHALTLYEFDTTANVWPPVDIEISLQPFSGSLELYTMQAVDGSGQNILPTLNCTTFVMQGGQGAPAVCLHCVSGLGDRPPPAHALPQPLPPSPFPHQAAAPRSAARCLRRDPGRDGVRVHPCTIPDPPPTLFAMPCPQPAPTTPCSTSSTLRGA